MSVKTFWAKTPFRAGSSTDLDRRSPIISLHFRMSNRTSRERDLRAWIRSNKSIGNSQMSGRRIRTALLCTAEYLDGAVHGSPEEVQWRIKICWCNWWRLKSFMMTVRLFNGQTLYIKLLSVNTSNFVYIQFKTWGNGLQKKISRCRIENRKKDKK